MVATIEEKEQFIEYWKLKHFEFSGKLKTEREKHNSTRVELLRVKAKLRDVESSGKLISGLATPLCLFGALIIILVVCVCLYQNSGGGKNPNPLVLLWTNETWMWKS